MNSSLDFRRNMATLNKWIKRNERSFKIILQHVSRLEFLFPSDKRSWTLRRWEKHFIEFAHQFSSRPDWNNTAKIPCFTLCTALSAIPFVSDLRGVDVQRFQSSQTWSNFEELSLSVTFDFLSDSKNFWKLLCNSCEVFVFARIWLDPLGDQILHHDCISMIGSRFTSFTKNFCDLLLSSLQKFQHEVQLRHCVICTGPL